MSDGTDPCLYPQDFEGMKRIIDETEHNQLDADDVIVLTTHLKGERYKNAIIFFKD